MVAVGEVLNTFCVEAVATWEDIDCGIQLDGFQTNRTLCIGNHAGRMKNNFLDIFRILHTGNAQ